MTCLPAQQRLVRHIYLSLLEVSSLLFKNIVLLMESYKMKGKIM